MKPSFDLKVDIVENSYAPLIDHSSKGSENNVDGYENGYVIKLENGEYHMLITELFCIMPELKQGSWSPARIGHWVSRDNEHWVRKDTVVQGNAIAGDPRENTWSPSYYWNEQDDRWNIFWRGVNSVFRYESVAEGYDKIDGPYREVKLILSSMEGKVTWDFGAFASFSNIFQTQEGKYAVFYSTYGILNGQSTWPSGLAFADSIDGPWYRNPYSEEPAFQYCENPYVYRYDGIYYCVYDDLSCQKSIGLGYSVDGIEWERKLIDLTDAVLWANDDWYVNSMRTPMSLIREDDGSFTVYFTAAEKKNGYFSVGKIRLRLEVTDKIEKTGVLNVRNFQNFQAVSGRWLNEYGELSQDNVEQRNAMLKLGAFSETFSCAVSFRCVDVKPKQEQSVFSKEDRLYNTRAGVYFGKRENAKALYCVTINADSQLILYRGEKILRAARVAAPPYIFKKIRVTLRQKILSVYYEDDERPVIRIETDSTSTGEVGLVVNESHWHFEEVVLQNEFDDENHKSDRPLHLLRE